MRLLLIILLIMLTPLSLFAKETGKETGLPIPRFVSLKFNKSNLRNGPGMSNAIKWTYLKKGYPMEVIDEFSNWRKLRDVDGTEGWINENLVTGRRNVLVIDNKMQSRTPKYLPKPKEALLFRHPSEDSCPIARVEFGIVGSVKRCTLDWCNVKVADYTGWIQKINLWGVYREEIL